MAEKIDTGKVKRRMLRFETLDEALAELDRIASAEQSGKLRTLGNWTAGQVLGHVAAWIDYGYEGYPLQPPPWFAPVRPSGQRRRAPSLGRMGRSDLAVDVEPA